MPKYCISMATYRGHDWLKHISIPALVSQYASDWRLYLVSDGLHNFKTQRVVEEFKDKRIVYLETPKIATTGGGEIGSEFWNIAGVNAINVGMQRIQKDDCEFILHIDQDDWWHPTHAQNMISLLNEHPESDFAYAPTVHYAHNFRAGVLGDPFDRNRLLLSNNIAHSSIAYRKNSEHDFFYSSDPSEPADYRHLKSFLANGKDFVRNPVPTVAYFQRCDLAMAQQVAKQCS